MNPALSLIYSRAQVGITAPLVTVEVHLSNGLPHFSIVGLPEKAVKESKDRVRSALLNALFSFPSSRRITVNLAPADLPKEGGRFDLPIALGILLASRQLMVSDLECYEFAGELTLSGELLPIRGTLPMAIKTAEAQKILIIPAGNADEAALVRDLTVLPARSLLEVCGHLAEREIIQPYTACFSQERIEYQDLSDVCGQEQAKRALTLAAAGEHSLLMTGPPGTGKTLLASRLPGLLPAMTEEEAIEVAAVFSIVGRGFSPERWRVRPFRSPHHTASSVALVGGGSPPRPGEISLAHCGVLFLDELPEFDRKVLEALREPLESGTITISRAARQAEFPARFQLIAAMNPCPCGHLGNPQRVCRCGPEQVARYQMKISGPMLDRIDLHVTVPPLPAIDLISPEKSQGPNSMQVRAQVEKVRQVQLERQGKSNHLLTAQELAIHCVVDGERQAFLGQALERLSLSARTYHRVLRVARTIADLEGQGTLSTQHLAEALAYRPPTWGEVGRDF